eukprot:scpid55137/ scgid2373/ Coiled-coil domain-containing protein 130; 9 kDa protein
MAERKTVNKYYPPEWRPEMGSINKYRNSHPLRDRARKMHEGVMIIRFELPYNIWCGGCGKHVGMGVRYNSEKRKVGNYYTTPIYRFRMKCHLCDNHFEIETDPKNMEYVIVSGATRKEERWDSKDTETVEATDSEAKKRLASDPMYRLEHGTTDAKKAQANKPRIAELQASQEIKKDDYALNQLARRKFRGEKRSLSARDASDRELLAKGSMSVALLPESEEDRKQAKAVAFKHQRPSFADYQREKRLKIQSKPLFGSSLSSSSVSSKALSVLQQAKRKSSLDRSKVASTTAARSATSAVSSSSSSTKAMSASKH